MQNGSDMGARLYGVASAHTLVNLNRARRRHANPLSLFVQHFQERVIILIEQDRRARRRSQLHRTPHMIDVRMRDSDLLDLQVMLSKQRQNRFYLVARVNDHRFMRALIANNRTVALDGSDREYFVDHAYIVTSTSLPALVSSR